MQSTLFQKALKKYDKMQIELGIPVMAASMKAKELKYHTVISANGADELFCGYDYYRKELENGYEAVRERTWRDLEEEEERNYKRESSIATSLGMSIEYPYLFEEFMLQALAFPSEQNITSIDDRIRKHILRKLAIEMGVPEEFAMRPKKAMQYGSGVNKYLKKAPII